MRPLVLATVLIAATLAGCVSSDGTGTGDDPPGTETGPSDADRLAAVLADHPEFCESETESGHDLVDGCKFWDDRYHEVVVYDLDTVVFDVVIVPPAGMTTPDQIATSRQAVQAWRDGILELAEPWLADAFEINVYAVGVDVPSLAAVQDPEIVVISSSAAFIFGIGLEPKQLGCLVLGETTVQPLGGHSHGAHTIFAEDCTGTGFTCFAINVGSIDPRSLYDLIAHEVGHCLGAGHVGDALDFRARYAPVEDIMSYQANPDQVHCVSNLNVRTLEGIYAPLLGRPAEEHLPDGAHYHMSPLDYEQVACANPPGM